MNKVLLTLISSLVILTACTGRNTQFSGYEQISQEKAWEMMQKESVIILDVREVSEYESGHIPGALLLPVGTITAESAAAAIPEQTSTVLVYCRSGNRSKKASQLLAELGYTAIYEFGGISTWPFGVE